jgi:hypothetical protein
MFTLIGLVIVLGGVIGGYLFENGPLHVLIQPTELVIIFGAVDDPAHGAVDDPARGAADDPAHGAAEAQEPIVNRGRLAPPIVVPGLPSSN